jgi:hypothetical protein
VRATTKRSAPQSIRLNVRVLEQAAERRNWVTDRQLANGLGINPGTISRLLSPYEDVRTEPSPRFIAAALNALPELSFEDLFSVHVPRQRERAA